MLIRPNQLCKSVSKRSDLTAPWVLVLVCLVQYVLKTSQSHLAVLVQVLAHGHCLLDQEVQVLSAVTLNSQCPRVSNSCKDEGNQSTLLIYAMNFQVQCFQTVNMVMDSWNLTFNHWPFNIPWIVSRKSYLDVKSSGIAMALLCSSSGKVGPTPLVLSFWRFHKSPPCCSLNLYHVEHIAGEPIPSFPSFVAVVNINVWLLITDPIIYFSLSLSLYIYIYILYNNKMIII